MHHLPLVHTIKRVRTPSDDGAGQRHRAQERYWSDYYLEYGSVDALPVQPVRPRRKLVGHFLSRSQVKKSAWARSGEYPTEGNSGVTGAVTGAAVVGIPGAGAIACAPRTWGPADNVAGCVVTESNPAVRIYDRTL